MIKTVIIDDEVAAVDIVEILCGKYSDLIEISATANTIAKGIKCIEQFKPELVFLDIEFPEGSGFDVLRAFPKFEFHTVFITAFDDYALEAIKNHALYYILKPVDYQEFQNMLDIVTNRIQSNSENNRGKVQDFLQNQAVKKIGIPDTNGVIYLDSDKIVRIEASGPYCEVHLINGKKYVVSRILKTFEKVLSPLGFKRVHRSHIVNLEHILSYSKTDGGLLFLSNNQSAPVARKYKTEVVDLLVNRSYII